MFLQPAPERSTRDPRRRPGPLVRLLTLVVALVIPASLAAAASSSQTGTPVARPKLLGYLAAADKAVAGGAVKKACNSMKDFIAEVQAKPLAAQIDAAERADLVARARQIRVALGCT